LGSNVGSKAEKTHWPIIDSRIFATHGSNEIGRKSVGQEWGRGTFGTGITSADFHIGRT